MSAKLIGVLMGGVSREREISLRSGKNVAEALQELGYKIKIIDITSVDCREQIKNSGIDVAFNILHGQFGEDGGIQAILEELKIPYTGSGVKSSQNCMNKLKTKRILLQHKMPTAEFAEPQAGREIKMSVPLVIKPALEGSSFGISIVQEQNKVAEIFDQTVAEYGQPVFVEKFISGAEVTVGVLKKDNKILALPILELIPKNKFYDFEAKYTPGGTEFVLPAKLAPEVTALVQRLAERTYQVMHCHGGIRVDFVVAERKDPYILEVNTIPGMTNQSDLPAEAKAAGMSFNELVDCILQTASLQKF